MVGVGPFEDEGTVKDFNRPVSLWSIGAGEFVHCRTECVGEQLGSVARPVVAEDLFSPRISD